MREELDEEVRVTRRADAESGAAEAVEGKPALADERAGVLARLGVKMPEDLHEKLVWKTCVDPIMASHIRIGAIKDYRELNSSKWKMKFWFSSRDGGIVWK